VGLLGTFGDKKRLRFTWEADECKTLQADTTKELHPENKDPWRIEDVAAEQGFDLKEVLPFEASAYDGYEPRRVGPQK